MNEETISPYEPEESRSWDHQPNIEQEGHVDIPEKIKNVKRVKEFVPESSFEDGHEGPVRTIEAHYEEKIVGTSMGHDLELTKLASGSYYARIDGEPGIFDKLAERLYKEYDYLLNKHDPSKNKTAPKSLNPTVNIANELINS